MSPRRAFVALAVAALAAVLAGCAASGPAELPPAPAASAALPSAAPATPAATPARASAPAPAAVRDSTPSPAALAVLASIPEPLGARVPEPPREPAPAGRVTPEPPASRDAAPDSAKRPVPVALPGNDPSVAPLDTAMVPVPTPTAPLGSQATVSLPPTPEPPPATPAPASPPMRGAPTQPVPAPVRVPITESAASDTCWRLQVGAPAERARGNTLRAASQSLLVVPMTVAREGGRWKVRTRDCLSRTAAESLRDRAIASGFKGVFLVRFVEPNK